MILLLGWSMMTHRLPDPLAQPPPPEPEPLPHISVALDQQAIAQPQFICLPDSAFALDMPPMFVDQPVAVELSGCAPEEIPPLPPDKKPVSRIYRYAMSPAPENRLRTLMQVRIAHPDSATRGDVYVYEPERNTWSKMTGSAAGPAGFMSAKTRRTEGIVVVLADRLPGGEALKQRIRTPKFLVADVATGDVLLERSSTVQCPIASLTKLMTALVFLDHNPNWDTDVVFQPEDRTSGSRIYLRPGDHMSVKDLFHASLVRSANDATMALVRSTGLSLDAFVVQMNQKARALGMENTAFAEPTGLSSENRSTAQDYIKLARHLLQNPVFREVTTMPDYQVKTLRGTRNRTFTIRNTNQMVRQDLPIVFSKTGFTLDAGRCLLVGARNAGGREVVAVVMGAQAAGIQYRDMRLLLKAALDEPEASEGVRF